MSDDQSVNEGVEAYRHQLTAEAELARGDLDEIEDHMRTLVDELRAMGMPAGVAVAEAARRLGDPRQVAREHARVSHPFGERLPRARAWLAALALTPTAVQSLRIVLDHELGSGALLGEIVMLGLIAGLAFRLSWARPVLLGWAVTSLAWTAAFATLGKSTLGLSTLGDLTVIALLVPWRRSEIGAGGCALALLVPAYGAANVFAWGHPMPVIAASWALIAGTGIVLRARWAAPASALCAVALCSMIPVVLEIVSHFNNPDLQLRAIALGILGLGVAGAAFATVFAWRNAHCNVGTLKYVLR